MFVDRMKVAAKVTGAPEGAAVLIANCYIATLAPLITLVVPVDFVKANAILGGRLPLSSMPVKLIL